ncbi:MAG: hypothetical protein F6K55_16810 [Moorea sp. SIO4A3]|nr:hypothetical protein [Moorena sp. SIO4A3]
MKIKLYKLPLIVILAGILFSLYLQWQIPDEVFFSGDAGLKALQAKQFASGDFRFDLHLSAQAWVQQLWNEGLYPFEPPFAYKISQQYFSQYPFTFPLVTAPFYALFGFRGLYILPLASLWALWFSFSLTCQRLKLGTTATSLALATLIFASPLSLYGAMYWEHTLAIFLAFEGLVTILVPNQSNLSTKKAILGGILLGLSVWFRPEFLCLVGIVLLLSFVSPRVSFIFELAFLFSAIVIAISIWMKAESIRFIGFIGVISYAISKVNFTLENKKHIIGSMLLSVAGFFGLNAMIYHHPLGTHGLQVVEEISLRSRGEEAFKYFQQMNYDLLYYFPIIFFPFLYLLLSLVDIKLKLQPRIKILFIICILFIYGTPILLPSSGGKQWGPRFLLILIPLISLLAIVILKSVFRSHRFSWRLVGLGIFAVFFSLGIYTNTYIGTSRLLQDYRQRVFPALTFLRKEPNSVVAVSHQFIAQELQAVFGKKTFFITKNPEDLQKLIEVLIAQKQSQFILLCYTSQDICNYAKNVTNEGWIIPIENNTNKVVFDYLNKFKELDWRSDGGVIFYRVSLLSSDKINN